MGADWGFSSVSNRVIRGKTIWNIFQFSTDYFVILLAALPLRVSPWFYGSADAGCSGALSQP
jgi:hypothetical protein